jgi:uncharacterized membrane protein
LALAQVAAVGELYKADNHMSAKDLFKGAYRIGVTHINAMTNTLFLAYTGASLPLLILFSSEQSAFSSVWQVVSNEAIATEIVRTLIGSIGLVLTVPIATGIAVWWHTRRRRL